MDFLSKGYSVLKGEKGQPQSAEATIEKLCDRAATSALLEDRRAAVLGLKGLAKDMRVQVGSQGLGVLCKILLQDQMDLDIINAVLDTLCIICRKSDKDGDRDDVGVTFSEVFLKADAHIGAVISVIDTADFHTRYSGVVLLNILADNRLDRLQQCILACRNGPSVLISLLDEDEALRNEGLLLLNELSRSNAEMQQILVFQDVFPKLLDMIFAEFGIEGGIIIEDCLKLFHTLLDHNVLNQNHLRESGLIPNLRPFFAVEVVDIQTGQRKRLVLWSPEYEWGQQSITNACLMVRTFRLLCAPKSPSTPQNQIALARSEFLPYLLELGVRLHIPPQVRAASLNAVADLIRKNAANGSSFERYVFEPIQVNSAGQDLPHAMPALLLISQAAIRSSKSRIPATLASRAAAVNVLESLLVDNPDMQFVIASTLQSEPVANPNDDAIDAANSVGSMLATVLIDWDASRNDPFRILFACSLLTHILFGNAQVKALLLDVSYGSGDDAASLIGKCVSALLASANDKGGVDIRIVVGYMQILAIWAYEYTPAVSLLLSASGLVQFLIEKSSTRAGMGIETTILQGLSAFLLCILIEYNDNSVLQFTQGSLIDITTRRIGLDVFLSGLEQLKDSREIRRTPKYLYLDEVIGEDSKGMLELYFDPLFVHCFTKSIDVVTKTLCGGRASDRTLSDQSPVPVAGSSDAVVESYRQVIERQDADIAALKLKVKELELALRNQPQESHVDVDSTRYQDLIKDLNDAKSLSTALQTRVSELEEKTVELTLENEDALACLYDMELLKQKYKHQVSSLGGQVSDSDSDSEDIDVNLNQITLSRPIV